MVFASDAYRIEPLTGTLVHGIEVKASDEEDYHLLPVQNCTINWLVSNDFEDYIQGGLRASIPTLGDRVAKGNITTTIKLDGDGHLAPAIRSILRCAEYQVNNLCLNIKTNHLLSPNQEGGLKAVDTWPTDHIGLLILDTCLITKLSIQAQPQQAVKLSMDIIGIVDARNESDLIDYSNMDLSYRALEYAACSAWRYESNMTTATSYMVDMECLVEELAFINNINTAVSSRTDQVHNLVAKNWKMSGKIESFIRRGIDQSTYIKGGIMQNEGLNMQFGPVTVLFQTPVFDVSEQAITKRVLKRTISFTALTKPYYSEGNGVITIE